MGYNISGVVINKCLKNHESDLSKLLRLDLEYDCEIDFETASENWKDDEIIDVYFGDNGTLIFTNFELCNDESYFFAESQTLTFTFSETSMAFYFGYSINEKLIRSKMYVENEIIFEQGLLLKIEDENEDISEVIWKQIEMVFGKSFWEIELEEKAKRYRIKNTTEIEQPIIKEHAIPINKHSKNITPKKNGLIKLYILVALAILLLFGLIYVIYNLFMLP